jgi:hypothetical protein
MNPHVVAQQVNTPALILGSWIFGGIIAVGGAFIWAELAATMPAVASTRSLPTILNLTVSLAGLA